MGRLPTHIRDSRLVAKHVDLERTIRPDPDGGNHLPRGLGVRGPNPDGTESTSIRHSSGQLRGGDARHRSLDDGQLDSKLAEE